MGETAEDLRAIAARQNVLPFRGGVDGLRGAQVNEARLFCLGIVRSQEYRDALMLCALARTLHPSIERMIWHYAYGKPPDRIELQVTSEAGAALSELSLPELADRAKALAQSILQLPEAQRAEREQAEASLDDAVQLRLVPADILTAHPRTPKALPPLLDDEGNVLP